MYYEASRTFNYLNSPSCYCDFYNYARKELDHKLKPKAIDVNQEFSNPCEYRWYSIVDYEKESLQAIYDATNGQHWINNDGWMSNETDHCDWHGITCNSENFVTRIELNNNNLVGKFPVYTFDDHSLTPGHWKSTKYGLANLYGLQVLDLEGKKTLHIKIKICDKF